MLRSLRWRHQIEVENYVLWMHVNEAKIKGDLKACGSVLASRYFLWVFGWICSQKKSVVIRSRFASC